ncbi:hypothetical protein EKO27_g10524 [Xylaria grammica]|uniref:CENP-V/GFA domain-containing protein n=1 Tax=Xylaria grammica TaxID=363999 RepID=A0A439CR08_9PEZI|nr:hypothetical protein EKO27_g10524 [Xylaria grammica]
MSNQEANLKTYRANCHCAAYVYEVTLPEISTASQCNCSVCYKKAALWVFPKPKDVKFVKGDPATLTNYTFGKRNFTHKVRRNIAPREVKMAVLLIRREASALHAAIRSCSSVTWSPQSQANMRSLRMASTFDGASSLGTADEPPKFTGLEPTAEVEGGELYTGSCHCGAVTLALKSKPLNKDSTENFLECDCSHCSKGGYVWAYPKKPQIVIEGGENLSKYMFGNKYGRKTFCGICGVPIHNELVHFTDEELAAKPEKERDYIVGGLVFAPVNLRVINGLDVNDLNVGRFHGYSASQPQYVEPNERTKELTQQNNAYIRRNGTSTQGLASRYVARRTLSSRPLRPGLE